MADDSKERFSRRHGHAPDGAEITVREDAPSDLRYAVISVPTDDLSVSPSTLRGILCRLFRTRPDPGNWSEYPNIWGEVEGLIDDCEWYRVYDAIEAIYGYFVDNHQQRNAERYAEEINAFFRAKGIGWQLVDGRVEVRGEDMLDATVADAAASAAAGGYTTAQTELQEARRALSQRPNANLSGAVFHAFSSLECVARRVTGDDKSTLGELVKRHPDLFPKPLDESVTKAWGYVSNEARHGKEERQLTFADAQACVGLAATLCSYLTAKFASAIDEDATGSSNPSDW